MTKAASLQLEPSRPPTSIAHAAMDSAFREKTPALVDRVLRAPGEPLDPSTRADLEPRFGHNFGAVRVHRDPGAAESARAFRAKAYTVGNDIVFAPGRFAPATHSGRHLLAHELAHVVQQSRGGPAPVLDAGAAHERSADRVAAAVSGGASTVAVAGATGIGVARAEDETAADPAEVARLKLRAADLKMKSLELTAQSKTPGKPLATSDTVAAYDAINSALKAAHGSNDQALLAEAKAIESRFMVATNETPAALPSRSEPHPLASQTSLTGKQAFITNTAQRGFDVVGELNQRVAGFDQAMQQLTEQRKNAPQANQAELDKQIRIVGERLRNAREQLALLSTPQLKDPRELRAKRDELETKLEGNLSASKQAKAQQKLASTEQQIAAVQRAQDHPDQLPPLAAFRGAPLGSAQLHTYVTVEVRTADGTLRTYQARNVPGDDHAEDVILKQMAADGLTKNNGLNGAKIVVYGDQEVCKRCATRLPEFGALNGVTEIEGHTFHAPALNSKSEAVPDKVVGAKTTTVNLSNPESIAKREKALENAGLIEEGETLPIEQRKTFSWQNSNPPVAPPAAPPSTPPAGHDEAPTAGPVPNPSTSPAKIPPPKTIDPSAETATQHPVETATPAEKDPAEPAAPAAKTNAAAASSKTSVTASVSVTPPAPVKPAMKTSSALSYGGGMASAPSQTGLKGNVGVETKQERANGIVTGQKVGLGGNVNVDVQPIPGTYPRLYRVVMTLDVHGSASASASREVEGKPGASAGLSVSGSASLVYSHRLTAEQAERYRQAALSGSGQGDFAELKVAEMVKQERFEKARELAAQSKAHPLLAEGDELTFTAQGHVAGELGGTAGRPGGASGGVTAGLSRGKKVRIHVAAIEGKEIYTVMVETEKGWSLGAAASYYAVGMGYTRHGAETDTQAVSFILDPRQPAAYATLRGELEALDDFPGVQAFTARHPELAGSRTTGHGTSGGGTTSLTVLGNGLNIGKTSAQARESTVDASGVTNRYTGQSSLSASASVAGATLNKTETTDTFSATVGPDNKASGETSSAKTQTDYGRSVVQLGEQLANKPLSTLVGVATGGTKILQESTDTKGKKLTDESYAQLIKLAGNDSNWGRAAMAGPDWNTGNYHAWVAIRQPILNAQGDRNRISELLAQYEAGDSGRSSVVEKAVGSAGIRFEFPQQLAIDKTEYENLVVADPIAHARELEAMGDRSNALGALQETSARLTRLLGTLQSHREEFTSTAALAEMMRRLGDRQAETQAEIRQLTLASQPKKNAPDGTTKGSASKSSKPAKLETPTAEQQAETAARREERTQRMRSYISACLALKDSEAAAFDAVKDELDDFYVDLWEIGRRLNHLKDDAYPQWDMMIDKLRAVYQERGEDPERAKQFSPDRAQWNALHKKAFPL